MRLNLDDSRWSQLETRNGKAKDIPLILKSLLLNPNNSELFREMWSELCSEETVYSSAYAAIPYIVDIAKSLSSEQRFDYLWFIGCVLIFSKASLLDLDRPKDCFDYLFDEYNNSLNEALDLIKGVIPVKQDLESTCHLLMAIAALKGHINLAKFLDNIDCGCKECGADLME